MNVYDSGHSIQLFDKYEQSVWVIETKWPRIQASRLDCFSLNPCFNNFWLITLYRFTDLSMPVFDPH